MNPVFAEVLCIGVVLLIVFMEIFFFTQRIHEKKHPMFHAEENGIYTVHIYVASRVAASYEKYSFKRLEDGTFQTYKSPERKKEEMAFLVLITCMFGIMVVFVIMTLKKIYALDWCVLALGYVVMLFFFWFRSLHMRRRAKRYLKKNVGDIQ